MPESLITIVLPERSADTLSNLLRDLTEVLQDMTDTEDYYGLGGPHGYGCHYEDDTILMHPYCWCEREDCPWCEGCSCPDSAYHYYVDGVETDYDEWCDFYFREVYGCSSDEFQAKSISTRYQPPQGMTHEQIMELGKDTNARRSTAHDPICPHCQGNGTASFFGVPGKSAPNFWHKPSGLCVWWYKYIGRSMEVSAPENIDPIDIVHATLQAYKGRV